MHFTTGHYRMRNGNIAHIVHAHHNVLLGGWVDLATNKGAGLRDTHESTTLYARWIVRRHSLENRPFHGDFAAHYFGKQYCSEFDLIEKID